MTTRPMLPAEWEPQWGVILTWPHENSEWSQHIKTVEPVYIRMVKSICEYESVIIVSNSISHKRHILNTLMKAQTPLNKVHIVIIPFNDTWIRDYGPVTVFENGEKRTLDFGFNGWGNKFPHHFDSNITRELFAQEYLNNSSYHPIALTLEGGNLETNGQGILITTKECLLAKSRNKTLTSIQIIESLKELLGTNTIFWVDDPNLMGDDTDGHIDNLVRFITPDVLCYLSSDDETDPHYGALKRMEASLINQVEAHPDDITLVPLPLPAPIYDEQLNRLPASYLNFLMINNAVLCPVFNQENDEVVLETLRTHLPSKNILPIDSTALLAQGGNIHCATMQLPAHLS